MDTKDKTQLPSRVSSLTNKQIAQQIAIQQKEQVKAAKHSARNNALMQTPKYRTISDGTEVLMTSKERLAEAEKIYQWLIKEL